MNADCLAIADRMNARLARVRELEARMDRLNARELAELVTLCQQAKADIDSAQAWAETFGALAKVTA